MDYVRLNPSSSGLGEVCELFETAFPPEERPPFDLAISWGNSDFYAVYRDDVFVALADVVVYRDLVYLFFLAVKKEFRGQGIGTAILTDLKARYPGKRLFLLADEAEPTYADYPTRIARLEFYRRNGFTYRGTKVRELGVMYQLLCHSEEVTKAEFVATMTYLIGEEMAERYYADV